MKLEIGINKVLVITCLALAVGPPAFAQSTLFVLGEHVGIGNETPTARMHIDSNVTNGNVIFVRSTDNGKLLRLYETGATGGLMSLYDQNGNEDFRISAAGDSWFNSAGDVGIDCSSPDHDLTIGGSGSGCNTGVYSEVDAGESQFTVSSSREIKENLMPLEVNDILGEIGDIGVYSYDFINGPKTKIGIMAEDFHNILQRGSEKSINGHEVQMVLWLAVQELTKRNQELESHNGELAERLARIEALLASP